MPATQTSGEYDTMISKIIAGPCTRIMTSRYFLQLHSVNCAHAGLRGFVVLFTHVPATFETPASASG
jgi:hypothetical protein